MLKRLVYGLLLGLLVGGLIAAAVVKGLGTLSFDRTTGGTVLAYVFAAVTGVLVGLVAGKPIWASGGQIEAGLKAVVGALIGAGAMFAMRRWLGVDVDLHTLVPGISPSMPEAAGLLPVTTLPAIAAVLGAFYEADNTPEAGDKGDKSKGKDPAKSKVRVGSAGGDDDEEEAVEAAPKKKNGAAKR